MEIETIFVCDICSKQKQTVNHWWMITEGCGEFVLLPFDISRASQEHFKHYCGQECVVQAVNRYMQFQTKKAE